MTCTCFAAFSALELLPYYSRIVATLAPCMKDVGPALAGMLEEEFGSLLCKKDQMNLEAKVSVSTRVCGFCFAGNSDHEPRLNISSGAGWFQRRKPGMVSMQKSSKSL